jgi:hypothetical protein
MKEIHKNYFHFMEDFLNKQADTAEEKVSDMIRSFAINKIASKPSSRAHLMYLLAKQLDIAIDDSFYFVCASLELIMVQAYCYNVGADGKAGYIGDKKEVAFKTAELLKSTHTNFINNTDLLDDIQKEKLKIFTRNIYSNINIGQVFDTLINVHNNFNKKVSLPLNLVSEKELEGKILENELNLVEAWLGDSFQINAVSLEKFVWQRTYGLSGYMNEVYPEAFSDIFIKNKNEETIKTLKKFSFCYGMLLMIINDIQDFALDLTGDENPTREKILEDVFIDVKNERISYPVYELLQKNISEDVELIEAFYKHKDNISQQEMVREMMVNKGYLKLSLLDASAYAFIATDIIKTFNKDENTSFLDDLVISLVRGNKYIKLLSSKFDTKIKPTDSEIKLRKVSLEKWLTENKEELSKVFN